MLCGVPHDVHVGPDMWICGWSGSLEQPLFRSVAWLVGLSQEAMEPIITGTPTHFG